MSTVDGEATPVHAILRMLVPPAGYETSHALLCTYSLDLVVLAAMLAHLAGFSGDDVRVTRVSLATALTELHGKVQVLAQAGRVKAPPEIGAFHALLLRHVSDRAGEGPGAHWHPKLVVVRFLAKAHPEQPPIWRLWLGSHNLVRSQSWELGGILSTEGGRRAVAGLGTDLVRLMRDCGFLVNAGLQVEAERLTWDAGDPGRVERIVLPGAAGPRWVVKGDITAAVALSPFLDHATVKWLADRLPARSQLLTNREQLESLARTANPDDWVRLKSFQVLVLGPPEESDSTLSVSEDPDDDDVVPHGRGLHAKALVLHRNEAVSELQFGSANATVRGLDLGGKAPNHEVVARLTVSRASAEALLGPVLATAVPLHGAELDALLADARAAGPAAAPSVHDTLADLAAGLDLAQGWSPQSVVVRAGAPVDVPPGDVLSVATLLDTRAATAWPRAATEVHLPPIPATDRSHYVRLYLSRAGADPATAALLLRAPCTPAPDAEGDTALFRRALGPRGLLEWLRGRLDGVQADAQPWDMPAAAQEDGSEPDVEAADGSIRTTIAGIPMESILRVWARDRAAGNHANGLGRLADLDRELTRLNVVAFAASDDSDDAEDAAARRRLGTFLKVWRRMRPSLLPHRGTA